MGIKKQEQKIHEIYPNKFKGIYRWEVAKLHLPEEIFEFMSNKNVSKYVSSLIIKDYLNERESNPNCNN